MKKLLLLAVLLFGLTAQAQSDYYTVISGLSTSGLGRAPQGSQRYNRSVWLITATEMANFGFVTGNVINSLGFNYLTAQSITTTGNLTVYLENSADTANTKSSTWATAITGMTTVSNASITIPAVTGPVDFPFSGGTYFTYTGGGLYIAFDYTNAAGTLSTGNVSACNTLLTSGVKSAISTTAAPASLAATFSAFRPETRLGKAVLCTRPINMNATNITVTSADLTYTALSGGTVEVEYGLFNFAATGAGTIINPATSPTAITGLSHSTVYDYWTRKTCGGAAGFSAWSGPFSFNTPFQPANTPYNSSLEMPNFPFLGWLEGSVLPVGSNWQVQRFGAPSATNTLTQNGEYAMYSLVGVTTAPADTWVLSRGVNLTAGSTVTVAFQSRNYVDNSSTGIGSFNLTVGNAQTVGSQTTVIANEPAIQNVTYIPNSYTFLPTTTGVYYFGLKNVSPANAVGRQAVFIDNFSVTEVLATDSFLSNKFSVSPNPTTGLINVTNNEGINVNEITVTDLNGRVVKTSKFDNVTNIEMNISDLSSGMYMMSIKSDAGTATKKIVKQ